MCEFAERSDYRSCKKRDRDQNKLVSVDPTNDSKFELGEVPSKRRSNYDQTGSIPIEAVRQNLDHAAQTNNTNVIDICALNSNLHRRQVNRNLMSINLLENEGDYSGTFGSEIENRLNTHYGINVLADQFKGAKELARLIFKCPARQFPKNYNSWIETFLPGIEFVKPAELRDAAKILTKAGFYIQKHYFRTQANEKFIEVINSTEDVVERFGYVDSQVWTLYVSKGKIPAADPHDLCSHVAGFIEPVFRQEMKKMAE